MGELVGFCFWAVCVVLNFVLTMENSSYFSSVPDIIITSPIFESTEDSIPSIFVTTSLYQEEYDIADDGPPIDQTLLTAAEDNERFVNEKMFESPIELRASSCSCTSEFLKLLKESLQCPVCLTLSRAGVFQCELGHVMCAACRGRLYRCPVCRVKLGAPIRNLALEQLAHLVKA